jgi:signal transduction histidine kinase
LPVQPDEAGVRSFRHDFAEPFDAFAVELLLPTLPGGRGTGTIHALALLLALVATVGLFAVYRMVAVVVHFAERRSRFAASVSHELKTPLTSIRMYAEMLRDGLVPSEEKRSEYYRTITDESERLSRLIDNVLDFSRLERGEYRPDIRAADLRPVLREAVDKLEPHLTRHGFRVRFDEGDDVPQVAFDPDAVTQIVFNRVDNSVKYAADANDREIVISCAGDERGAEISVRDFGPGVPDHALASIFEPFHRHAAAEPGRATRGTGIGLALVKELAESLHGSASAENAEAGGLKVTVRLPRCPPPAPSA